MRLCEAIDAPYALELRDLLKLVSLRSRGDLDEMRAKLQTAGQAYVEGKLDTDLKIEFLVIPAPENSGWGGAFRAPGDYAGATDAFDLPPLPADTMQIILFADHNKLHDLRMRDHRTMQSTAGIIQHEMIHALQYIHSGGSPRSLTHMTSGRPRPRIAGQRVGKRVGGYNSRNASEYLSNALEIEAWAAQAAGDMIARVQAENPEDSDGSSGRCCAAYRVTVPASWLIEKPSKNSIPPSCSAK